MKERLNRFSRGMKLSGICIMIASLLSSVVFKVYGSVVANLFIAGMWTTIGALLLEIYTEGTDESRS